MNAACNIDELLSSTLDSLACKAVLESLNIGSLTYRPSNYTTNFLESFHITKSTDLQGVALHIPHSHIHHISYPLTSVSVLFILLHWRTQT